MITSGGGDDKWWRDYGNVETCEGHVWHFIIPRHKAGVDVRWLMFIQSHPECDFPLRLSLLTHHDLWVRWPSCVLHSVPLFMFLQSLEFTRSVIPSCGHWCPCLCCQDPWHLSRRFYAVGLQTRDSTSWLPSSPFSILLLLPSSKNVFMLSDK